MDFFQKPPIIDFCLQEKAIYCSEKITDSGKSWVEHKQLYNQWENLQESLKNCGPFYRNIGGTYEKKENYMCLYRIRNCCSVFGSWTKTPIRDAIRVAYRFHRRP